MTYTLRPNTNSDSEYLTMMSEVTNVLWASTIHVSLHCADF